MKKIVFLRRQYTPYGGAEKHFQRLVDEIRRRDLYDVELRHITQPKWLPSWLKLPLYDLQVCRHRDRNALYFSNDRLSCLDIHRAGGGTHKSFLKTKGFTLNPLHPVYLWLERRTLQNAREIIAISEMVKRDIVQDYGIDERKITVIYNGIEIEEINKKEVERRRKLVLQEFGVANDIPIILYVGSGFERKGVREFLHILTRLQSSFHAFVVGKEKRMGKYRDIARSLGLSEKVTFTGPRKDVANFYCTSDLFLFPTRYEPFGSVILEAMLYANAVVTTRQCGGGEVLIHEPRMEDSEDYAIAGYIDELLKNPEKLHAIQDDNQRIARNYSIKKNVDETIKVIERAKRGLE